MVKVIPSLLLVTILGAPAPLLAGGLTGDAMLGGALGGALGAGVGAELGGRDGAILGGAIGGATGTAITTRRHLPRPEVIYVDRYQYRYVNRPVYVAPRDHGPPPGYYYRPGGRRGHHKHHHDWD